MLVLTSKGSRLRQTEFDDDNATGHSAAELDRGTNHVNYMKLCSRNHDKRNDTHAWAGTAP